jgi:hypothetical protein
VFILVVTAGLIDDNVPPSTSAVTSCFHLLPSSLERAFSWVPSTHFACITFHFALLYGLQTADCRQRHHPTYGSSHNNPKKTHTHREAHHIKHTHTHRHTHAARGHTVHPSVVVPPGGDELPEQEGTTLLLRHMSCVIMPGMRNTYYFSSKVPLLEGFSTNYFTIRGVQYYLIYYY